MSKIVKKDVMSFAYNRVTMDVEGVLVCFAPMQAVLTAGESFGELAVKS